MQNDFLKAKLLICATKRFVPISGVGNKYTSGIDVNEKEISLMPFSGFVCSKKGKMKKRRRKNILHAEGISTNTSP